jgi:hypothetical protein
MDELHFVIAVWASCFFIGIILGGWLSLRAGP